MKIIWTSKYIVCDQDSLDTVLSIKYEKINCKYVTSLFLWTETTKHANISCRTQDSYARYQKLNKKSWLSKVFGHMYYTQWKLMLLVSRYCSSHCSLKFILSPVFCDFKYSGYHCDLWYFRVKFSLIDGSE